MEKPYCRFLRQRIGFVQKHALSDCDRTSGLCVQHAAQQPFVLLSLCVSRFHPDRTWWTEKWCSQLRQTESFLCGSRTGWWFPWELLLDSHVRRRILFADSHHVPHQRYYCLYPVLHNIRPESETAEYTFVRNRCRRELLRQPDYVELYLFASERQRPDIFSAFGVFYRCQQTVDKRW